MIRLSHPYLALLEALDKLGRAKKATDALVHAACVAFVEVLSNITGERVTVVIGQAVIARGSHAKT
ncbi:hypothetical protein [Caballeronia sp. INML2]|uniref:hypothetical protein n=1 Tax=Caballeronia sp. INML2 TaxID=2921748 RepID=UPI0020287E20|nr:hypothetical protein [Caballeronia sp. INML2]